MLNNDNDLRLITASLFYLSQEARNSNLGEVSKIIANTIYVIEQWANNENIALTDVLNDSSTLVLLSMYSRLSKIPVSERMGLLKILEEVDEELTEEEKENFGFIDDKRVIN